MIKGQAFSRRVFCHFFPASVDVSHEEGALAGGVAKFREEAGVLPRYFPSRGPALRVRAGGEGEISGVDALAG